MDTLFESHLGEIARKSADAFNIGKFLSDRRIESKTTIGTLVSTITAGKVKHVWLVA